MNIGINGFGRIGKCVVLQLLNNAKFNICCINAIGIKVNEIEEYLKYDSTHHYDKNFYFEILSENEFILGKNKIKLFNDRNASKLEWRKYNCDYLIDCTGAYLTTEKCKAHDVDYVIISAPAKDDTPTFIYGVNEKLYDGQSIVSGSSCITNCLSPLLKILNDNYKIKDCVFTRIHSTTSSQFTVDVVDKKLRTSRTILNNIIPHTTVASSSVYNVLPELQGLINGTSIRVPVLNCSLLDVNIYLEEHVKLENIINIIKSNINYKKVYDINTKNLVSCDFLTTTTPTILDTSASINMNNGRFKFILWYDNEWSYCAQLIRLAETMFEHNNKIKSKYYINSLYNEIKDNKVMLRLDFNVPMLNNTITDDYRIISSIPTIKTILNNNPKYLILSSHFGRPKNKNTKDSLKNIKENIEKYLNQKIEFLDNGISYESLTILNNNLTDSLKIYLLENLRFHQEETEYNNIDINSNEIINIYNKMANIFICDAFGCIHREHMSICAPSKFGKQIGYGHLIMKELQNINKLTNTNKKILCIIGGNKIDDKMPIINMFKNISNVKIFVAGGIAKYYEESNSNTYIISDGWGSENLNTDPLKIDNIKNTELNTYDIGPKSFEKLIKLINDVDIVFWNGSLGVIEHDFYKKSSVDLVDYLQSKKNIQVIIGGGETGSLVPNSEKNNIESNIYISTGGGALLEYIQEKLNTNKNLVGLKMYEK